MSRRVYIADGVLLFAGSVYVLRFLWERIRAAKVADPPLFVQLGQVDVSSPYDLMEQRRTARGLTLTDMNDFEPYYRAVVP